MKYIIQFEIILAISLVGELLNRLIPLPIPASIYGMTILFTALCTGLIKLSAVKETGKFLIYIMPIMFIPAAVGLIETWGAMQDFIVAIIVISIVSTILVMAAAGHMTQIILKFKGKEEKK
jgi:holin-like protein